MRRLLSLLALFALVFVGCAPSSSAPADTDTVETETTAPSGAAETTTAPGGGEGPTTTAAPDATVTTSGRPLAPDFTLELGDGGAYTLSEGAKPVYLVFWAEW